MYEYDFHTYSIRRRRSRKKVVVSFFGVIVLVGLLFLFISTSSHNNHEVTSTVLSAAIEEEDKPDSKLGDVVKQALLGAEGSYSVVVENLKTGESYHLNQQKVYESGSLYKLWVMGTVFEQINSGRLKPDTPLVGDVERLNKKFDIASEAAELTEGELDFTVSSALRQMITISHNYAALTLTEKVGLSSVKNFLTAHGFTESKVGVNGQPPATTAHDVALFFEKLSKRELADEETTTKMLDLLKDQQLNGKLPKYLPEPVVVAHKTGELGLFSHDAGIVYTENGEYIIVVLSKSDYPPGAEERIANISRAVYEYFIR